MNNLQEARGGDLGSSNAIIIVIITIIINIINNSIFFVFFFIAIIIIIIGYRRKTFAKVFSFVVLRLPESLSLYPLRVYSSFFAIFAESSFESEYYYFFFSYCFCNKTFAVAV